MSHENAQVTLKFISDTITSGTTSAEIDLKGGTLVALRTPASIASSTFTITVSDVSGGTYLTLKDPTVTGTNTRTYNITSSGQYDIAPGVTAGVRYVKIVYNSSETSKTFQYGLRSID